MPKGHQHSGDGFLSIRDERCIAQYMQNAIHELSGHFGSSVAGPDVAFIQSDFSSRIAVANQIIHI